MKLGSSLVRQVAGIGLEWFIATYASTLGAALSMPLLYPIAHVFDPGLSFRQFNRLLSIPYFPVQVAYAFIVGYFLQERFRTRFTLWIWVIPLSVLVWHFFAFDTGVFQNSWQVRFQHFTGPTCRPYLKDSSGRPCFDQLVYTAPVCTALAYAIGAFVRRKKAQPET